jgi:NHLM bacteriocin system ABC transporter ATP-binding protein
MADHLGLNQVVKIIQSNEAFFLDQIEQFFLVKSGAIAVFAVGILNGEIKEERKFLFEANSGDGLFSLNSSNEGLTYQLLATPLEDTELIILDFDEKFLENQWLQQWNDNLLGVFKDTNIIVPNLTQFEGTIGDRLNQFHLNFRYGLHQLKLQENQAHAHKYEQRLQLNQEFSHKAIADLTSIFNKEKTLIPSQGNALFKAVELVAQVRGIKINPLKIMQTENSHSGNLELYHHQELLNIANASRFRLRRVKLTGKWWQSDCGALLAYTKDFNPVALLPTNSGKYQILDPQSSTKLPVNSKTTQNLASYGYMFYRPFPEKVIKTLDILAFSLKNRTQDLINILSIGAIATLLAMLIPFTTGVLIDQVIPDGNLHLLLEIALCLLVVTLGNTVFNLTQGVVFSRLQTFMDLETQTAVWDRLLKLKVSFFRDYTIGDLQLRVSAISQIHQLLSGSVLQTIFTSIFAFFNLILMVIYSPQLTWVAIALTFLTVVVTNILSILTRRKLKPLQESQGRFNSLMVELIGGISKIRIAGAQQRAFAFWANQLRHQLQLSFSTEAIENTMAVFLSIISVVSPMVLFTIASGQIIPPEGINILPQNLLSTGRFLAFNSAYSIFVVGITKLGGVILQLMEITILWERSRPIMEAPLEVDSSKIDPGKLSGKIKIDQVNFRYREDSPLILENISLEVNPGEFIALVGPSGGGKSTLIRLLLGFDVPDQGKIYYDGHDLSTLDLMAVRRQLGVVLQDSRLNSGSIFENIAVGRLITLDQANQALEMAGIASDIKNLPMGLKTMIAQGGNDLSGGQRQRLLIARALVTQPKILLLDEATSALDQQTQAIVTQSLQNLKVTRIVVAHRLSTILNADRIYVIVGGKIVQQGNFEQLVNQKGWFADLMKHQFKDQD